MARSPETPKRIVYGTMKAVSLASLRLEGEQKRKLTIQQKVLISNRQSRPLTLMDTTGTSCESEPLSVCHDDTLIYS